ncbi:MAG: ISAs1 family transposase [Pseudanabaenaceae cyanobacterium bins.39]|nr:ISAs1 family transposase [Pseudanabaenaceae cyanobacterium bins.39]
MARIGLIFRNRLLQILSRPKRLAVIESCLIGVVSGLAAIALGYSVGWLGGWRQQATQILPAYIALPVIGLISGLIAGWLVEDVAPGSSGSGMAEVKAVLANVPMPLNLWLALIKWISTTLVLAAGMPLGREGPTVQIGAALANQLNHWFPTSPDHRRQLIAAGAGAGLAAAFDAPIAGVLFVVEELLQDVSGITLGTAILASFVASAIARLSGSHSLNLTPHLTFFQASFSLPEIPFYLFLGIIAGIFGVLFNRGILNSTAFYQKFLPVSLKWRIGLAGMFAGIALATLPNVFRDNAGLRQMLLSGNAEWRLVLLVFCVKFCLIVFAGGVGAPGGLLIPSMTLGSALGYLVGSLEFAMFGLGSTTTYAHVGMAAFFCAVSRVPITAVVIVFEMTTDFSLVLPLMIGTVSAYLISEKIETGSLYDHLLEAKGIHLNSQNRHQEPWTALRAAQVMQPNVETFTSDLPLGKVIQKFSQSTHRSFPVLTEGRLVGMVSQVDIAKMKQRELTNEVPLSEIMTPEPIKIHPSDTLAYVLHLFDLHNLNSIPVVDGSRLVGIITRSDVIKIQVAYLNSREDLFKPIHETPKSIGQASEIDKEKLLMPVSNIRLLNNFEKEGSSQGIQGKEHILLDIIAIATCAVISGGESWEDVALFAQSKQEWLRKFLKLPNGTSCEHTFIKVFARLNSEHMHNSCISTLKTVSQVLKGKNLMHPYGSVSVWISEHRLAIGQHQINAQAHDMMTISDVLNLLEINGCIVTIDAIECQEKLVSQILQQGADYVLAVKDTQGELFEQIHSLFEQAMTKDFADIAHDFCESIDKGYERLEIRRCWTLSNWDCLAQLPLWTGLQTIALVQSERRINGKVSTEHHYYISSLLCKASLIADLVRPHWPIANSLNWVLDISCHEDPSRICKDNSPENMAILHRFAWEILSRDMSSDHSTQAKRHRAAWDLAYLNYLISR